MTSPTVYTTAEQKAFQILLSPHSLRVIMFLRNNNRPYLKSHVTLHCRVNHNTLNKLLLLYLELGLIIKLKEGKDTKYQINIKTPITRRYLQLIDNTWDIVKYQMGKRLHK